MRSEYGSEAVIRLMDGSPALKGKVDSIARGITDQDNRDGPELLANVNPNFTWVRLAQRIPVRIHLTYVPPGVLISAGMTCTAVVKQDEQPRIGAGGRAAGLLGLNPSTLSRRIARLEDDLGVTLLERGRFGVPLTASGEAIMVHVRRTLDDLDALVTAGHLNG